LCGYETLFFNLCIEDKDRRRVRQYAVEKEGRKEGRKRMIKAEIRRNVLDVLQ
jgi:hypothetical protein